MLRDFVDGKVDPVFGLDEQARLGNIRCLREFVPLLKQDLAAAQAQPRPEKKKRALIYFEATDEVWDPSNEIFGWMFSMAKCGKSGKRCAARSAITCINIGRGDTSFRM